MNSDATDSFLSNPIYYVDHLPPWTTCNITFDTSLIIQKHTSSLTVLQEVQKLLLSKYSNYITYMYYNDESKFEDRCGCSFVRENITVFYSVLLSCESYTNISDCWCINLWKRTNSYLPTKPSALQRDTHWPKR